MYPARERKRTRDLLLEYDISIMPPRPRADGLSIAFPWGNANLIDNTDGTMPPTPTAAEMASLYPWANTAITILMHQFYIVAVQHGYTGSEQDYFNSFGTYVGDKCIIYGTLMKFPNPGSKDKLYFDLEEKILYYWDEGYIPVNAMLIANTYLDGGEA